MEEGYNMSEVVHYKGTLKEIKSNKGETLEELCKRMMEGKTLPKYCDTYREYLEDVYYLEMVIQEGRLYKVEKEEVSLYGEIYESNENEDGDIEFEVKYYNGGCSFEEAIGTAIEKGNRKK